MLPVFGHAQLYYQDKNGCWWLTEFNKKNGDFIVTNSIVYDAYLASKGKSIPISTEKLLRRLDKYYYLCGDYSIASKYISFLKYQYDYNYNLFTNNCLHYIHDLLNHIYYGFEEKRYQNNHQIIPNLYNPMKVFKRYYLKKATNFSNIIYGGSIFTDLCYYCEGPIVNRYSLW